MESIYLNMNFYVELFLKYSNVGTNLLWLFSHSSLKTVPLSPIIFSIEVTIHPSNHSRGLRIQSTRDINFSMLLLYPASTFQLDQMMVFALKMKFCNKRMQEDLKQMSVRIKQLVIWALKRDTWILHITQSSLLPLSVQDFRLSY